MRCTELVVPLKSVTRGSASLRLVGLKPYHERVVDLAQGLETEGPVHVVATKIFGRGKFYVAVTRCRDLNMLKISGIDNYQGLRRLVKSNAQIRHSLLSRLGFTPEGLALRSPGGQSPGDLRRSLRASGLTPPARGRALQPLGDRGRAASFQA